MTKIRLKAYRIAPRKPSITADSGALTFRLPTWFGGHTWSVPLTHVGVVDLRQLDERDERDTVVFDEPIDLPYVFTTSPAAAPNIGVLFSEPVRLPPLRWLVRWTQMPREVAVKRPGRGVRPAGRFLDGMLLRAVDPTAAVEELVTVGAERVTDPDAWLAARRAVVTDPVRVAQMELLGRRFRMLNRLCFAVVGAGAAAYGAGQLWLGADVAGIGVVVGLLALVGQRIVERRSERAWFKWQDAPSDPRAL